MSKSYLYDDIGLRKGFKDFGQGSYKVLPTAIDTPPKRMQEIGYTLYQDFEHDTNLPTRWFFKDIDTWKTRIERIEQMGYKAIDKLQIT